MLHANDTNRAPSAETKADRRHTPGTADAAPDIRFGWLIAHLKKWEEILPSCRGAPPIVLFFYPWYDGHEVCAELSLSKRDPRTATRGFIEKKFNLTTCDGQIVLRHKGYRVSIPEDDRAGLLANIDNLIIQFWADREYVARLWNERQAAGSKDDGCSAAAGT